MRNKRTNLGLQHAKESINNRFMDSLPSELIMEILSRVPTLDLAKLRCVCKIWRDIIGNPQFRSLHSSHSLSKPNDNQIIILKQTSKLCFVDSPANKWRPRVIKFERLYESHFYMYGMVGSCNGLLCLGSTLSQSFVVLNPLTRQHLFLPMPQEQQTITWCPTFLWGFGFDCVNKLFKVMMMTPSKVSICDLGSGRSTNWRTTEESFRSCNSCSACFLNGRLYWPGNSWDGIISFHLTSEDFKPIPKPDCLPNTPFDLIVLKGCLCIFSSQTAQTPRVEIWVMREDGIEGCWIKEYDITPTIPWDRLCSSWSCPGVVSLRALESINEQVVLLWCTKETCKGWIYISFDPACDQFKILCIRATRLDRGLVIHTASLNWI